MVKNNSSQRFDIIGIGEPLLRLSPPGFEQLRRAQSLEVHIAGAQINVIANLARLGLKTQFLTKLPDNPLGNLTVDAIRSHGVDTSQIQLLADAKMGVTYVEQSVTPRAPLAIYDRTGSAASSIAPGDFDLESLLTQTNFAYTDGIFSALSESTTRTTFDFFSQAKRLGVHTCFDMNFRSHLLNNESARENWSSLLEHVDILVTNRNVSEQVFGYRGEDRELMQQYVDQFGCKIVCITYRTQYGLQKGEWNSMALCDHEFHQGDRKEFDIVDRYGTGDAWFSGFLYGVTQNFEISTSLNFGNALCALAHTTPGDVACFKIDEIKNVMQDVPDISLKR